MNAEAPVSPRAPVATNDLPRKSTPKSRIALIALFVFLGGCYLLRNNILWDMGRLLTSEEEPRKADIVVVLGGDRFGKRIMKGAELVRDGFAPRVVVSGVGNMYGSFESDLAVEYAIKRGAPREIFMPTHDYAHNTVEEAGFDLAILRRMGIHSVLVVTSSYHTRRAGQIFRRMAPELEIHTVAAPDGDWNGGYWWKTREGRKTWLYEALKSVADIFRL